MEGLEREGMASPWWWGSLVCVRRFWRRTQTGARKPFALASGALEPGRRGLGSHGLTGDSWQFAVSWLKQQGLDVAS